MNDSYASQIANSLVRIDSSMASIAESLRTLSQPIAHPGSLVNIKIALDKIADQVAKAGH